MRQFMKFILRFGVLLAGCSAAAAEEAGDAWWQVRDAKGSPEAVAANGRQAVRIDCVGVLTSYVPRTDVLYGHILAWVDQAAASHHKDTLVGIDARTWPVEPAVVSRQADGIHILLLKADLEFLGALSSGKDLTVQYGKYMTGFPLGGSRGALRSLAQACGGKDWPF